MNKIFAALIALAVIAGAAHADPDVPSYMVFSNLTTNDLVVVTNSTPGGFISGYLDAIKIDLSGVASPTGTLTLATQPSLGTGESKVLFSASINSDTNIYPRASVSAISGSTLANQYTRIFLSEDRIQAWWGQLNVTGVTARVTVSLSRRP